MTNNFKKSFPGRRVAFDKEKKAFSISGSQIMFAVKDDKVKEWMFLGYEKKPELVKVLYPEKVIKHFKLL